MRNVEALARSFYPLPQALGLLARTEEHGYYRRGIEDYQRLLAEVARIVGVPEPTYRHVRRLVKLD